jgi:predicted N-acetyltransferase YhbS
LLRERPRDSQAIEDLTAAAFGPDRFHKTVYRLREDVPPIKDLCFVCLDQKNRLVASIRNWPVLINDKWPAVMLGPLSICARAARAGLRQGADVACHGAVAHAGPQPHHPGRRPEYYNQFGFRRDLALHLQLPGWVEERRFLALELVAGAMIGVHGMVGKAVVKKKRATARPKRR